MISQLTSTQIIDLMQTEEELWSGVYKSSRRYANGARKRGCIVREGDEADLPVFYEILAQTAVRSGFIPRALDAYTDVYRAFARHGRARLLLGYLPDGTAVSSKMILVSGGRASQLYGGLTDAGGEARAGHFFEWEAIIRSKASGADDLRYVGQVDAGHRSLQAGFRWARRRIRWGLGSRRQQHRPRRLSARPASVGESFGDVVAVWTGGREAPAHPRVTEHDLPSLASALATDHQLVSTDPPPDKVVSDVVYDSRRVRRGSVFVAIAGQHADGHAHAAAAAQAGAVAVIGERAIQGLDAHFLQVRDGRAALAVAAACAADRPADELGVVGITGTDGKTTTAYLVRAMLEGAGNTTGLVGTTDVIVGGRHLGNDARTTTPEAPELQGHLAAMRAAGDRWVVIEATSHGLAQERVGAIPFDVAVLTNVTTEHLEFHGTQAAYRAAKRRLFSILSVEPAGTAKPWGKHAIINADDGVAMDFGAAAVKAGADVIRYGLAGPPRRRVNRGQPGCRGQRGGVGSKRDAHLDAHAKVARGRASPPGQPASTCTTPSRRWRSEMRWASTPPRPPVHWPRSVSVPGRMQRIDRGQPFTVVVDYAHTADSLGKVLDELAPPLDSPGGLIAVFGSAGERDTQKRPQMGRVAAERCRLVIVTDEDPRGEDRDAILDAIALGAEASGKRRGQDLLVVPDRAGGHRARDVVCPARRHRRARWQRPRANDRDGIGRRGLG